MGEVIGSNGGIEIECWREIVPVVFHEARFAHYHSLDVPFEQFSEYMHHLIHSVKNNQDYGDRFFINILAPQTPTHLPHSIEFIITQGQMGCLVQCKRLSLAFTLASDAELKEHLMSCFERLELHERNRYFQRELEFSQTLIKSAETIQRHYESLLKQQHNYKHQLQHQQSAASLAVHHQQQPATNQFQYQSITTSHQHAAFPINNEEKPLSTTMTSLAINPADINLLMTSSDPYFYQQQRNSQQNNMINNQLLSEPDPHLDNVINFLTSNCASNNNQNQSIQNDHNSMIERTRNTNRSRMNNEERAIRQQPSPILAAPSHNERHEQQHELVTPTDEGPPSGQFETHMPPNMTSSLTVANPMSLDFVQTPPSAISNNSTGSIHYRNSPRPNVQIMPSVTVIPVKGISSPAVTVAVSDPKKLKGAAKRKASFHNLTNNNSSNTNTNTAQGQAKIGENSGQSSCSLAIEPMKFMGEDRKQDETKNSLNSNNNNVLYHQANGENNTGIIDNSANDTITTAAADIGNSRRNNELINNINPMDQCVVDALNTLLDQRNVINDYQSINQQHLHSQGHHSNHVTFMETESFREYLNGDVNQVVTSATSMSPRLGSTNNELVDNLSNLTDSDWRNMKLEYDAFAPVPPTVPYVAATVAPTPVRKSAILAPPPPLSGTHRIQMQQNAAAVHSPSLKVSSPMHQQQRIATPESISCRSAAVSTPGCSSSSVAARLLQQTTRCLTPADETSYTVTAAVRDVSESPDSRVLSMDGVLSYFKCLICDKSFQMGLAHMAQHVSNDSTTCTFCNDSSRFDSKEELIKHMMSHSARVYACQYCGKENPRVHYLKIHVRSHTGEKPYTCHQCGRGFADASTWRRHERVHTGEKPYQCNICGRKIARRDNVKIHMRSHMRTKHGTACRVCGKTFTQPNHLMLHERVCTNAAEGASPSPHGSPIGVGNAAVMAAAADQSAVNALLTVSPSCVSPAAAISDVKMNNLMRGTLTPQPPHTSQSPMNIIAAIEADTSKMAALVHHFT